MRRPFPGLILAPLLYGAIALAANAALALTPAERDELKALRSGEMSKLVVHEEAKPPLEAAFRDGEGNRVTLADYAGKVVVLNVWATWCAPCRAEMPALDALAGGMEGPALEVIAVSTDRAGIARVERFFADVGIANLEVMHDRDGDVQRKAGVLGLPVTLILDREGREIARMIGDADWDTPEVRKLIGRIVEMTRPAGEGSGT